MAGDAAAEYFGRALAAARAERGMKRMQLKERSGLSYPYISEIENGGKYPSQRAIQSLAAALDMTPSELVARGERIESGGIGGRDFSDSAASDLVGTNSLPQQKRLAARPADADDDEALVDQLTEQVMRTMEEPLREWLVREVQMTVREELLRRRDNQ